MSCILTLRIEHSPRIIRGLRHCSHSVAPRPNWLRSQAFRELERRLPQRGILIGLAVGEEQGPAGAPADSAVRPTDASLSSCGRLIVVPDDIPDDAPGIFPSFDFQASEIQADFPGWFVGTARPDRAPSTVSGRWNRLARPDSDQAAVSYLQAVQVPDYSHIVLAISANQSKGHADVLPHQGARDVHRSDSAYRLLWF